MVPRTEKRPPRCFAINRCCGDSGLLHVALEGAETATKYVIPLHESWLTWQEENSFSQAPEKLNKAGIAHRCGWLQRCVFMRTACKHLER